MMLRCMTYFIHVEHSCHRKMSCVTKWGGHECIGLVLRGSGGGRETKEAKDILLNSIQVQRHVDEAISALQS